MGRILEGARSNITSRLQAPPARAYETMGNSFDPFCRWRASACLSRRKTHGNSRSCQASAGMASTDAWGPAPSSSASAARTWGNEGAHSSYPTCDAGQVADSGTDSDTRPRVTSTIRNPNYKARPLSSLTSTSSGQTNMPRGAGDVA